MTTPAGEQLRIGLVCPYSWDVPGGVQAHVRDLAAQLQRAGHDVAVLTPAEADDALPPHVTSAGRPIQLPYNGSIAPVLLGPISLARVRRWIMDGDFDVVHVHEPVAPSISLLACWCARGPLVATFHTANPRSRAMTVASAALTTALEKITAKIAVSDAARRTVVEHLGGDPFVIPNGVDVHAYATAPPLALPGGSRARTICFVGRIDEPRKGLDVLLAALPAVLASVPDLRLLVAGPGDVDAVRSRLAPDLRPHVEFFGLVDELTKRSIYRAADCYVAPHIGGESFGIVLVEAMAAGAAVIASDLEAFVRVLDRGRAGRLVPVGDPDALAGALVELLGDPAERGRLIARGRRTVQRYDWPVVVEQIVGVYRAAIESARGVLLPDLGELSGELPELPELPELRALPTLPQR